MNENKRFEQKGPSPETRAGTLAITLMQKSGEIEKSIGNVTEKTFADLRKVFDTIEELEKMDMEKVFAPILSDMALKVKDDEMQDETLDVILKDVTQDLEEAQRAITSISKNIPEFRKELKEEEDNFFIKKSAGTPYDAGILSPEFLRAVSKDAQYISLKISSLLSIIGAEGKNLA